jgi:DNA-binding transcriptional ArsR family regulator
MRDILAERQGAIPSEWMAEPQQLRGFSPVVLAPVPMLGAGHMAYYHEIDRSLFDGMAYEPFIVLIGADAVLALGRADAVASGRGARKTLVGRRSSDPAERWASVYAALGDPTRVRIVRLLAERPRYGQELAAALHISSATISHHMDALARAGVLALERRAHRTYFTLQGETLATLLRNSERYLLTGEDGMARGTA